MMPRHTKCWLGRFVVSREWVIYTSIPKENQKLCDFPWVGGVPSLDPRMLQTEKGYLPLSSNKQFPSYFKFVAISQAQKKPSFNILSTTVIISLASS